MKPSSRACFADRKANREQIGEIQQLEGNQSPAWKAPEVPHGDGRILVLEST